MKDSNMLFFEEFEAGKLSGLEGKPYYLVILQSRLASIDGRRADQFARSIQGRLPSIQEFQWLQTNVPVQERFFSGEYWSAERVPSDGGSA